MPLMTIKSFPKPCIFVNFIPMFFSPRLDVPVNTMALFGHSLKVEKFQKSNKVFS